MLSEHAKATLKLIVSALAAALTSAITSIMASGNDSFAVFKEKPSVTLGMAVAVLTVIATALTKSPAQGAALDQAVEAKAEAKVADRVLTAVDTGQMHQLVAEAREKREQGLV